MDSRNSRTIVVVSFGILSLMVIISFVIAIFGRIGRAEAKTPDVGQTNQTQSLQNTSSHANGIESYMKNILESHVSADGLANSLDAEYGDYLDDEQREILQQCEAGIKSSATLQAINEWMNKFEQIKSECISDKQNAEKGAARQAEMLGGSDGNVDWSVGKSVFIDEWAARIDSYMGSAPLAGYGRVFAEAAWEYGVDPRYSPAISCVESGKGSVCYRSYNAWGYGGISWGSWEEAIWAHVAGLAKGYHYTVCASDAQKYCPPTWESWYSKVTVQMSLI